LFLNVSIRVSNIKPGTPMNDIAQSLRESADSAYPNLLAIPEARASEKPYPRAWSIKEILGHCVDSAANNHQRIVRMQETPDIGRFTYTQGHWVDAQRYNAEPWRDLVDFWYHYNLHLAHIIANVDPASLGHVCDMGYAGPAPLGFVIEDYLRHVRHHLGQIFSDRDPREREKWTRREPR
jgi:hypothetical protein